ncbi:MAG: globin domain-containing protein [Pseudomonadota bacterium]
MTLSPDKIATLRSSWSDAAPHADALLTRFYAILFEMAPDAAAMFAGTDMEAQKSKLGAALGLVIREIETPGKILPALHALGRRHAAFGVAQADYDVVGAALLAAFAETLGDAFCDTTREAWATAYATVAAAMIAGGAEDGRICA